MNIWDPRRVIWLALAAAPVWACGDDGSDGDGPSGGKSGGSSVAGAKADGGSKPGAGGAGAGEGGEPPLVVEDGGEGGVAGPGPVAGAGGDVGEVGGSGGVVGYAGSGGEPEPGTAGAGGEGGTVEPPPPSPYIKLPSVLSLSGCTGVGPLCSVTQTEGEFSANCGGRLFLGELAENGNFTLEGAPVTATNGSVTTTTCTGSAKVSGITASCSNTVTPSGGTPSTTQCTLAVDPLVAPGISCLALPKKFDNLAIAPRAPLTGATVTLGALDVIQDGCNFQATAGNQVLTGTVSKTGLTFSRTLVALADAQTPNPTTQNPNPVPAFLKDANVNHSCTATISGSSLTGECTAGNTSGGSAKPATSLYNVTSSASGLPDSCSPLGPFREKLFVLDSCALLEQGEGGVPGIGEPICAFQQNGCSWQVTCGPQLTFGGVLKPGDTKAQWTLQTGTPCEASFDASGKLNGKCTVPGQAACGLTSKPPAPAPATCPQLPTVDFTSHGCGGVAIECRETLQHGCNFAAICDFSEARFPDQVFQGTTSSANGVDKMSFNGLGGRVCEVQKATATEIATPSEGRVAGEWYGDCKNAAGGGCRNNFTITEDPANPGTYISSGYRGFRLYFEQ